STSGPAAESYMPPGMQANPGRNCSMASRKLSAWPPRSLQSFRAIQRPGRWKSEAELLQRSRRAASPNVKTPVRRGGIGAADDCQFLDTGATEVHDRRA